ncbi:MAG: sialate O-acetylesterase [Rubripirellula sp.]
MNRTIGIVALGAISHFLCDCLIVGAGEPIDVILVAGQSNAVGYDAPPGELPADTRDSEVMFWWRCGDPPPDKHDSTSAGWTTLRPQTLGDPIRPRSGRQYGNFAQPAGGFGPEMGMARRLVRRQQRPLAVIKVAFSGTHVAGDWSPNPAMIASKATTDDSQGACYRSLVDETKRALNRLRSSHEPRLVALVWVQGESDATAERYQQYQSNLDAMIQSLRDDLGSPDLFALIGVNAAFKSGNAAHMPEIIAAQRAYCASDPLARYVDTAGVSTANPYHFDARGTLEVGHRFAATYAELAEQVSATTTP